MTNHDRTQPAGVAADRPARSRRATALDDRPSYEGRPLPHPEEELVDQGLAFDVGTLLTRRRVFGLLGLGAGSLVLAACGAAPNVTSAGASTASATPAADPSLTEIPDETAGPYPGDGSNGPDALEQSGIVRSDIRQSFGTGSAVAEGVPLVFELTILDLANGGAPFAGVAVYAWHCTNDGRYSMYASGLENENFLRGVQVADDTGLVRFTSIVPGCYSGRWPHIHFEVYPDQASIADSANAIATSQLALPQNMAETVYATTGYESSVRNLAGISLATDNVFGDDGGVHQIAAVSGDNTAGWTARLTVPVDTRTAPTGGGMPGGGSGGPGGSGGSGGPGGSGGAPGQ